MSNLRINTYNLSKFSCEGKVHKVSDFIRAHSKSNILRDDEKILLTHFAERISDIEIPANCSEIWTPNKKLGGEKIGEVLIENLPAPGRDIFFRSVFIPSEHLKIKGISPPALSLDKNKYYGNPIVFDETPHLWKIKKFPFGTHNVEGILRRLLGISFCIENQININMDPLAVWEYKYNKKNIGYALVLNQEEDTRLDGLDMYIKAHYRNFGYPFTTIKTPLSSKYFTYMDALFEDYSEIFFKFHSHNGFYGICNSHPGNMIISNEAIYPTDFETFHLRNSPLTDEHSFWMHLVNSMSEFWFMCSPLFISEKGYKEYKDILGIDLSDEEKGKKTYEFISKIDMWQQYITRMKEFYSQIIPTNTWLHNLNEKLQSFMLFFGKFAYVYCSQVVKTDNSTKPTHSESIQDPLYYNQLIDEFFEFEYKKIK